MSTEKLVRWACVLGLVSLSLMASSVLWPSATAVVAAMTVGQIAGTASLGIFALAVFRDAFR